MRVIWLISSKLRLAGGILLVAEADSKTALRAVLLKRFFGHLPRKNCLGSYFFNSKLSSAVQLFFRWCEPDQVLWVRQFALPSQRQRCMARPRVVACILPEKIPLELLV